MSAVLVSVAPAANRLFAGVKPMLLEELAAPPADTDEQWAVECKYDGWRALVFVQGGRVKVLTRGGHDITAAVPELQALATAVTGDVILDGELVAFHEGKPNLKRAQCRLQLSSPAKIRLAARSMPIAFCAFDVLYAGGQDVTGRTYRERRAILEALGLKGPAWTTVSYQVGGASELFEACKAARLEGIVIKRLTSTYSPGSRSASWIKIKTYL